MRLKCLFIVTILFIQVHSQTTGKADNPDGKSDSPETTDGAATQTGVTNTTDMTQATTTPAATTTTTTIATTTTTTTSTATTSTTQAPKSVQLGDSCNNVTDCTDKISGDVTCNVTCKCANDYFEYNKTTCLSGARLIPTVTADSTLTTKVINVTFSHTNIDNIDKINVTYNVTAQASSTFICKRDAFQASCSSLVPGRRYNVTVYVMVNGTSIVVSNSTMALTKPAMPGALNKTLSNYTGPNVTLVWGKSPGDVEYYVVTPRNGTNLNEQTNISAPEIQFYNLRDGWVYAVSIMAFSNQEMSDTRTDIFKTTVKAPDPPTNLRVVRVNSSSLTLQWDAPADMRGDFRAYQICWQSKVYDELPLSMSKCTNVTDNTLQKTFAGLSAGTFFKFKIGVFNEGGFFNESNVTVSNRTHETAPGPVSNLSLTPENGTLKVTWERPDKPNGDIIAYSLKWWETVSKGNYCEVVFRNASSSIMLSNMDKDMCPNGTVELDISNVRLHYRIEGLKAYTSYDVFVTANTSVGEGPQTNKTEQTNLLIPDEVTEINATVLNSSSVHISWSIPRQNPGLINYTVIIWDDVYNTTATIPPCYKTDYTTDVCIQRGLRPYWKYRFSVMASNSAGQSNSTQTPVVITEESRPGAVAHVGFDLYSDTPCDATKVRVMWSEPRLQDRHSNISQFLIREKNGSMREHFDMTTPDPWGERLRPFNKTITVQAEGQYNCTIQAVSNGFKKGTVSEFSFKTGNCEPPRWGNREDIKASQRLTNSIVFGVDLSFFNDNSQGNVIDRGFIVALTENPAYQSVNKVLDWMHSSRLYRVKTQELVKANALLEKQQLAHIKIGSSHCGNRTIPFCNKFLRQDTDYYIRGYSCTKGYKCRETDLFGPFRTAAPDDEGGTSGVVIGSAVFLVLVILAVAVFVGLWYKGFIDPPGWFLNSKEEEQQPLTNLCQAFNRKRPIPINMYEEKLEELHRDTNLKLSDQYEDIGKYTREIAATSTFEAANLEANKPKNRWVNILPSLLAKGQKSLCDEKTQIRQLLQELSDQGLLCLPIEIWQGFSNTREYIATQGPLPGTIDDFWRMVWEQNVKVIIMLTQCKEGNRVKCEMYWPNQLREAKQYGDIVVNPISISPLDKYNISIFTLTANGQERQVTHLHYLDFPDFSANVEFNHFVDFVKTSRSLVPHDNDGPLIVHCSAGVGRTGTFIALDRLQNLLNSPNFSYDLMVDIFEIVLSLRDNRVFMVQTESQFVLIHDCFLMMLEAKRQSELKSDSDDNLYSNEGFDPYPEVLYENINGSDMTTNLKPEL